MKKLLSIFVIAVSLITTSAYADLKAAFIDSSIIFQEAPQAKLAEDALKKEFQGREDTLRSLAEEIQKEKEDLLKDAAIMSSDQKKKMEKTVMEKYRKFRSDSQSLREDIDLCRKQVIQKLSTEISAFIQEYSEMHGYDLVFTEGVAFAADKVNITQDILKAMQE